MNVFCDGSIVSRVLASGIRKQKGVKSSKKGKGEQGFGDIGLLESE